MIWRRLLPVLQVCPSALEERGGDLLQCWAGDGRQVLRRCNAEMKMPLEAAGGGSSTLDGSAAMAEVALQSYYFDRDDVALQNFSRFFHERSAGEREHAEKLIKYQNERGGRIVLQSIEKPARDEWASGLEAMEVALQLEKTLNQAVLDLHKQAGDKNDPHMTDFLESPFLTSSVDTLKTLGNHITSLRKLGTSQPGMAEYLFDKHTLG